MCWELLAVSATACQETLRIQVLTGECECPYRRNRAHFISYSTTKFKLLESGRGTFTSRSRNFVQSGQERASFVIQRRTAAVPPSLPRTSSNPRPLHLNPPCATDTHRRITTEPDPSLDFTIAALLYLGTAPNDRLVPPCAHTITTRSCFGNIPLLILRFTLSLSCVSQLRRSGRHLDALSPASSFIYEHRPSDHTPVGEKLLSSARVVKDGRRGTELSNLEVHTVSAYLNLTSFLPGLVSCLERVTSSTLCSRLLSY
jgi:hypothetical protein